LFYSDPSYISESQEHNVCRFEFNVTDNVICILIIPTQDKMKCA